jgi:hypothetical protein
MVCMVWTEENVYALDVYFRCEGMLQFHKFGSTTNATCRTLKCISDLKLENLKSTSILIHC